MEPTMKTITADVHAIPPSIADSGKVRVGNISPAFPPVVPTPTKVADSGKMQIGNISPAFPPRR